MAKRKELAMKILLFVSALAAMMFGVTFSVYALDYTADLSLSLSEQYNDNIFLSHTDRTTDYITLISPAIALSTRFEKADVSISYSPTFNLYKDHDENNSTSHAASLLSHYRLTEKLTLGLSDTFVRTRESSAVRAIEGAGPINRGLERITTNSLSGDLSYRLTGKISLLGNAVYTYTDTETGTGDVSTYTGGLGASYLFSERTTFRINASYTLFDYTVGGNSTSSSYTAGIIYRLTPTITADAFGGIVITRVDEPKRTDTGYTGGLSVTKTFERGTASIAYLQNVIAGVESTSPVRSQTVTLRYAAPVTTSLGASISAFYNRYKSIGSTGTSGIETNRTDMGGAADLSYGFLPWLSGTLSYSYVHSNDKLTDTGSYVNNIVMAGIRLSKQARF